jgi:hypothetical protein
MHGPGFHEHHVRRYPAPTVTPHLLRPYPALDEDREPGFREFQDPETRLADLVTALEDVNRRDAARAQVLVGRILALYAGTQVVSAAAWRTGALIPFDPDAEAEKEAQEPQQPWKKPGFADGSVPLPSPRAWNHRHDPLPLLANLERLEIHAEWASAEVGYYFQGDAPRGAASSAVAPLPNLRIANLSGYVPRHIVRYVVVGSAPTLERLELALLNAPIGSKLMGDERANVPHPFRRQRPFRRSEEEEEQQQQEDTEYDDDSSSDDSDLEEEIPAPRPLTFLSVHNSSSSRATATPAPLAWPRLRHLSLSKPSAPYPDDDNPYMGMRDPRCSKRAEAASLRDWALLLRAAAPGLEVLVLEHRPTPRSRSAMPRATATRASLRRIAGPGSRRTGWWTCWLRCSAVVKGVMTRGMVKGVVRQGWVRRRAQWKEGMARSCCSRT